MLAWRAEVVKRLGGPGSIECQLEGLKLVRVIVQNNFVIVKVFPPI